MRSPFLLRSMLCAGVSATAAERGLLHEPYKSSLIKHSTCSYLSAPALESPTNRSLSIYPLLNQQSRGPFYLNTTFPATGSSAFRTFQMFLEGTSSLCRSEKLALSASRSLLCMTELTIAR